MLVKDKKVIEGQETIYKTPSTTSPAGVLDLQAQIKQTEDKEITCKNENPEGRGTHGKPGKPGK